MIQGENIIYCIHSFNTVFEDVYAFLISNILRHFFD
nr:MAG TPA: hypothetical protein [Caudoviricetes sp.]